MNKDIEFSRNIRFRDKDHNLFNIEIEVRNVECKRTDYRTLEKYIEKREVSICGEGKGYGGQCLDIIIPRTEGQKKLLELWRMYHLGSTPGTYLQNKYLSTRYYEDYQSFTDWLKQDEASRPCFAEWKTNRFMIKDEILRREAIDQECFVLDNYMREGALNYLKNHNASDVYVKYYFLALCGIYKDRGYQYGKSYLHIPIPDDIIETIGNLCEQIEDEEDALTEELEAVFDMGAKDFTATQEIIDQVIELRDCGEDEAEAFVALGIYLGVTFGDLNDTFESCGNCRYEAAGDEYYVGTEDQLESIAQDIVRNYDYEYLWRECVRAEKTLQGFYEWGDEVIKIDGWASILNSYDGCYSQYNINGTYICVSRT